jgi:hypothetical protein
MIHKLYPEFGQMMHFQNLLILNLMTISFLSINLWPDEVRYQLVGQIWNELGPFKPTFWNRINHDSLFGLPAEFRTSASTLVNLAAGKA